MTGSLDETFTFSIGENSQFPSQMTIIGNHDQYVSDFWQGQSAPAASVFKRGIKIMQAQRTARFALTFDSVEVNDELYLYGADKIEIPSSISVIRSRLEKKVASTDSPRLIIQKDMELSVDKSVISTQIQPIFFHEPRTSATKIQTIITNTAILNPSQTPLSAFVIFDNYFNDDVVFFYNSIALSSFKLGVCPAAIASVVGNLFWSTPLDDCQFMNENSFPQTAVTPTPELMQSIEGYGCLRPYTISTDSPLRRSKDVQLGRPSSDLTARIAWDFCGRYRDVGNDPLGAIAQP